VRAEQRAKQLVFNGIDGASGDSLLPPLSAQQISTIAQGEALDERQIEELKRWHQRVTTTHLGPTEGVDPKNLAQTRRAVFFGTRNSGDDATAMTADELIAPLVGTLDQAQAGWTIESVIGAPATKACLTQLLSGGDTPSLLFTATIVWAFRTVTCASCRIRARYCARIGRDARRGANAFHRISTLLVTTLSVQRSLAA
jgi:hypothetical protein